ncbi:MAG: hypothetical protein ACI92I_000641 [Acidimicrobiales bacterium]|jgi:uncharacterized protein YjbI with pentapeptide repeats
MIKPVIDVKRLEDMEAGDLCTKSDFEGTHVLEGDLSGEPLDDLSLEKVFLEGVTLNQCKIADFSALDCIFSGCNFAGVGVEQPYFTRLEVKGCRMQGIQLAQARVFDSAFFSSKLNTANFRFSKIKKVLFDSCDLSEVDFINAELKDVVFTNCNLSGANFSQAVLTDVDIAGSQIENIIIDPASIKQMFVDTGQALYLSSIFGLKIRD